MAPQTNEALEAFPPGIAGEVHGDGPTLLWGHGLTSCRANENELNLFGITGIDGYRVVRWDAPGHGSSLDAEDDETTTWPRLASLMLDIARRVDAPHFIAAGASMGCATSLWAAVTDPSAIDAMVLVIPPTAWETRAAQVATYYANADLIEREGIDAYLAAGDALPYNEVLGSYAPRMRAVGRPALRKSSPTSFAHVLRGAGASNFPERERLAELDIPAIIFSWEGDPGHPVTTGEELERVLPNAVLHRAGSLADVLSWRDVAAEWLDADC